METSYKIIGGDGREYGPASLDEMKAWILDGRVGHATQVWRSDNTIWAAAGQFQELGIELSQVRRIPPPGANEGPETVGFWPRLGAYLLDQLVLSAISFAVFGSLLQMPPAISETFVIHWPRFLAEMALLSAYSIWLTAQFGATIGKMAVGVRVVRMNGSPVGFGLAALRFLATFLSSITLCIGYLMIGFRPDHRSLHDLVVGTQVVYKR